MESEKQKTHMKGLEGPQGEEETRKISRPSGTGHVDSATESLNQHATSNINLGTVENRAANPFRRGGAVQRSPPTKNAEQENDPSIAHGIDIADEYRHVTEPRDLKGLQDSKDGYKVEVGKVTAAEGFLRPMQREMDSKTSYSRPLEKASEADVSDSSLASTTSTASGTRKRRQPYLCKPGKAKTAANGGHLKDPYKSGPTTKAKKDLPTVENMQHDMKDCTSAEVINKILESISTIEKVADCSRTLKGTYAQNLRGAARSVIAAATELAKRGSNSDIENLKKENSELRAELAMLRFELTKVTTEVNSLRQREVRAGEWTQKSDELNIGEDPLARHISALVEEKLVEFRDEILSQTAYRPSSEKTSDFTRDVPCSAGKTSSKKTKKNRKETTQSTQTGESIPERNLQLPEYLDPKQSAGTCWAKVTGQKTKPSTSTKSSEVKQGPGCKVNVGMTPRIPKTAAITVTLTESATINYATAMAIAKQRVNLADCGISQIRQRKSITGGLVLEITGPECSKKADALAKQLRVTLSDMGVRIARPVKTGEMRIMDLDESITKQDIAEAIAEAGGCSSEDVKVGEVRFTTYRLGTVWVRCPILAVRKITAEKNLRVGWISARVRELAPRQMQCFRCLEKGHVRKQCQSTIDRSSCCYCCGVQGHKASECDANILKCIVCADLGRPADHRLGGPKCNPPQKGKTSTRSHPDSCDTSNKAKPANQPAEMASEAQKARG